MEGKPTPETVCISNNIKHWTA